MNIQNYIKKLDLLWGNKGNSSSSHPSNLKKEFIIKIFGGKVYIKLNISIRIGISLREISIWIKDKMKT